MSIFRRMGSAIARFMYGRNGMDQLGLAMIWGSLLLNLVTMFSDELWVFYYLAMGLCAVAVFRMLSRNVYKRQAENRKWVGLWSGVKTKWSGARARHADKAHRYFTCKSCKAICRVPVGKGKVVITCPKCGGQIQGKT